MTDNKSKKNLPELLAPAGNLEKLKIAIKYGADAVYFGLPDFSLRAKASKFTKDEIKEGVEFCRKNNKKFFVALNIYAHNIHIDKIDEQLNFLKKIKPDGIILSDPGILRMVKKELPKIDIHISTQANVTNKEAAKFWQEQGAKRIILAREVSLKEIKEIRKAVPEIELEYFVHGAMCMAYSGRCILSKWMLNRSANLGDCAQPCRWSYFAQSRRVSTSLQQDKQASFSLFNLFITKTSSVLCSVFPRALHKRQTPNHDDNQDYTLTARIVDDKNRFEIDIEENTEGTYLFNSNDICLVEHLKELENAGIDSFKIEGRNKSVYYVAMVVRAYRKVLEALRNIEKRSQLEEVIKNQKKELEKLSNRGYWTGFAFQNEPLHLFEKASNLASDEFVGISLIQDDSTKSFEREVFAHNFFALNNSLEAVTPEEIFEVKVLEIVDKKDLNKKLESAHGGQNKIFKIKFDKKISGVFLLRKKLFKNKKK